MLPTELPARRTPHINKPLFWYSGGGLKARYVPEFWRLRSDSSSSCVALLLCVWCVHLTTVVARARCQASEDAQSMRAAPQLTCGWGGERGCAPESGSTRWCAAALLRSRSSLTECPSRCAPRGS
eukprot:1391218-Rhodomonas_salina.1